MSAIDSKVSFLILAIDCQDNQAIWIGECGDCTLPTNFTVAGSLCSLEELGTKGVIARHSSGSLRYNETFQKYFLGNERIAWKKLMDLIPEALTGMQGWIIEVDSELLYREFEGYPIDKIGAKGYGWGNYFINCIPHFMHDFGVVDPFEGIEVVRHEVSQGEEIMVFPHLTKVMAQGQKQLWCGGCEVYSEVFLDKYSIVYEDVPHNVMAKFSVAMTNGEPRKGENFQPGLIYMDNSGGFKFRCVFKVSSLEVDDEPSHCLSNGFGEWEGFSFDPDRAFYFESCSGSRLKAIPSGEGVYRVEILPSKRRETCVYSEVLDSLIRGEST